MENVFKEWNLKVNPTKTEFTTFEISEDKEQRHKEQWISHKVLGSKIDSTKNIQYRVILANQAFNKFRKVWLDGSKVNTDTKIKLYEAMIPPILTHNCYTWAAPEKSLGKLKRTEESTSEKY